MVSSPEINSNNQALSRKEYVQEEQTLILLKK